MNTECLFCDIWQKKTPSYKVYENKYVYAFLDIFPVSNGHTLVIPKKHFPDFSNTSALYLAEVSKASALIAKKIYHSLQPKGMNFISNEQNIAFQQVFHYHMHIVPKYEKDMGYNFKIIHDEENMLPILKVHELLK